MKYISTRGETAHKPFSEVLLMGLAPDGGLMLPEHYPQIDRCTLDRWRGLDYPGLAFEIMRLFVTDIPEDDLRDILDRTYTEAAFGTKEITPVRTLSDGIKIQALSNGPTLAFKDMAMQFLGNAFEYVLNKEGKKLNILGATSGDTGSAAEYALRGKKGVNVFMLSPDGKMSAFQRAQMYSLQDGNIHNIAVKGMFDDCQDIVKAVQNDAAFKEKYHIGTVNSINWGRIVAQVVYYFAGYFKATQSNDEQVSFCVPSGNFGNVCAGHIAKQMGLPIRRLIVATNENDVLDEFFKSTHADRLATIKQVYEQDQELIDPHTADGVKVAREVREEGETVVCLETALAAKFDATIREAVGDVAIPRPAALEGLEKLPQRVQTVPNSADAVKGIIEQTLA